MNSFFVFNRNKGFIKSGSTTSEDSVELAMETNATESGKFHKMMREMGFSVELNILLNKLDSILKGRNFCVFLPKFAKIRF